jgi:GNAT superfamily N-acetyltransferase
VATEAVTLRDLQRSDIYALAQLHVDTFRETHGGGPGAELRAHQWRTKLDGGKLVFCVLLEGEKGDLIGFASGERNEAAPAEFEGLLDKIYVLREYHRSGLGRRLLCASAACFLAAGIRSMLLFGDARSPFNQFYEVMAGERLLSDRGEFHGSYGWRNLEQLVEKCSS